jgi:hypothetical protein
LHATPANGRDVCVIGKSGAVAGEVVVHLASHCGFPVDFIGLDQNFILTPAV